MTLKEAHEIQRRELMSLRAKVARFEKQSSGTRHHAPFPSGIVIFMAKSIVHK